VCVRVCVCVRARCTRAYRDNSLTHTLAHMHSRSHTHAYKRADSRARTHKAHWFFSDPQMKNLSQTLECINTHIDTEDGRAHACSVVGSSFRRPGDALYTVQGLVFRVQFSRA